MHTIKGDKKDEINEVYAAINFQSDCCTRWKRVLRIPQWCNIMGFLGNLKGF